MSLRRFTAPGMAAVLVVGLAGALAPQVFADDQESNVDWGACPKEAVGTETLECATVAVPLDYDKPDGKKIEVMISRLASRNPDERRGVLVTNPGGPGGAGLSLPADLNKLGLPTGVKDSYDVIGMDPRGVGFSTPVSCGFTEDQGYQGNIPPYAPDEAAVEKHAKAAKKVADQCADNDPDGLMRHVTTANTARDLDFIRQALGEKKISYFGASYGTKLGAAYASMFPDHSDRIVLDSNGGGAVIDYQTQQRFARGMEDTFPDYADWLAQRHDSYGLGETPATVKKNYFKLAERLDDKPVAEYDGALFRFAIFFALYGKGNYAWAAQLWQSLAASDEQDVRSLASDQPHGTPDAPLSGAKPSSKTSKPATYDNAWSAYLAVSCNDTDWPEDVQTYKDQVADYRQDYPMYGAAAANISPCAYWHNDPAEGPVEMNDEGPENVLLVQNLRDPATPHIGAEINREQFGDRARLVSVDDSGHGVYVFNDNPCALNTTTKFLVGGKLPRDDVYCADSSKSGLDLNGEQRDRRDDTLDKLGR